MMVIPSFSAQCHTRLPWGFSRVEVLYAKADDVTVKTDLPVVLLLIRRNSCEGPPYEDLFLIGVLSMHERSCAATLYTIFLYHYWWLSSKHIEAPNCCDLAMSKPLSCNIMVVQQLAPLSGRICKARCIAKIPTIGIKLSPLPSR